MVIESHKRLNIKSSVKIPAAKVTCMLLCLNYICCSLSDILLPLDMCFFINISDSKIAYNKLFQRNCKGNGWLWNNLFKNEPSNICGIQFLKI